MDSTIVIIDMEKGRTSGDGMEQAESSEATPSIEKAKNCSSTVEVTSNARLRRNSAHISRKEVSTGETSALPLPGLHTLYRRRPEHDGLRSLAPVIPRGQLVPLVPRLVTPPSTLPEHKKTKPPKFVPYEPYPGAVNPIVNRTNSGRVSPKRIQKTNKNNLDIGVLVSQMSTIRCQEMDDETHATKEDSNIELTKLQAEVEKLKEERNYYHGQFKFQTQVNSELKNLLVASVGEDLQTRVNLLTEDKLQLARALLDTANNLSTHTEQIEFLAGQSEVWRSKFLASSVMVEELARWKADLTQKNQMLNESTKRLLQLTHQLRDMQLEILKNLKFVAKIRYLNLPSTDVISLSAENLNILQQMVLHSGVGMPDASLSISSASSNPLSDSETFAVEALDFISQPLIATDEAIRALFDQAQRPFGSGGAKSLEQKAVEVVGSGGDASSCK